MNDTMQEYLKKTREEIQICKDKLNQLADDYKNNKLLDIYDEYTRIFKRMIWLSISCYVNGDLDALNNIGVTEWINNEVII